jgi:hypothetical protein
VEAWSRVTIRPAVSGSKASGSARARRVRLIAGGPQREVQLRRERPMAVEMTEEGAA